MLVRATKNDIGRSGTRNYFSLQFHIRRPNEDPATTLAGPGKLSADQLRLRSCHLRRSNFVLDNHLIVFGVFLQRSALFLHHRAHFPSTVVQSGDFLLNDLLIFHHTFIFLHSDLVFRDIIQCGAELG